MLTRQEKRTAPREGAGEEEEAGTGERNGAGERVAAANVAVAEILISQWGRALGQVRRLAHRVARLPVASCRLHGRTKND